MPAIKSMNFVKFDSVQNLLSNTTKANFNSVKMKLIILGIFVTVLSLCSADDVICVFFGTISNSVEYYCNDFVGEIPEHCSEEISNSIPSSNVKRLKISGCEPNTVLNTIRRFPNVRELDISYSEYFSLDWLDLQLNGLKTFNASHNELLGTPSGLFKRMPHLREIDLSHNHIEEMTSNTLDLKGLTHLIKINLSNNQIPFFISETFMNLSNLKYVDVTFNPLKMAHTKFRNIQNINVNLRHTSIGYFHCSDFKENFVQMSLDRFHDLNTNCDGLKRRNIWNFTAELRNPLQRTKFRRIEFV